MCGINGIFAYHDLAAGVNRDELVRTRDRMASRGPDGQGAWLSPDGRIGLGHRRLAIIDLSPTGAQPMASADDKLVVTFNGEIYNHRELRRGLEAKGRVFRSQSDTEVLLHLYADKGEGMVHDLRGMFAFALWDADRHTLLLARDPCGIKPLYYANDGRVLRFASQVKALLAGGAVAADADPAGWLGFYVFGHLPEPFTTHSAIRALPAGTTMMVDWEGRQEPRRYHSIAGVYAGASGQRGAMRSLTARREAIRAALLDSVRHHLVADVSVGAFLSAGIDSGALVGLMRDAGQSEIQTVTLAFAEFEGRAEDEAPLAAEVARAFGTQHTTRTVTRAEFQADLPRILEAMDQPSIDGINTWFVSKAAHELGLKVAISGLGGDELFGGYPSFEDIPRWVRWLRLPARIPLFGRSLRRIVVAAGASRLGLNPKSASLLEYGGSHAGAYLLRRGLFMPWELGDVMDPNQLKAAHRHLAPLDLIGRELSPEPRSDFARIATMESTLYMRNQLLRDTDWASMAHSLEVRTPLADSALLATLAEIGPAGEAGAPKKALAEAPSQPLPRAVLERRKTGFGIPVAPWLQGSAVASKGQAYSESRSWARYLGARGLGAARCPCRLLPEAARAS